MCTLMKCNKYIGYKAIIRCRPTVSKRNNLNQVYLQSAPHRVFRRDVVKRGIFIFIYLFH